MGSIQQNTYSSLRLNLLKLVDYKSIVHLIKVILLPRDIVNVLMSVSILLNIANILMSVHILLNNAVVLSIE